MPVPTGAGLVDHHQRAMTSRVGERPWGSYLSLVSVLLLILSVVAFSDNLFTNISQPSNRDPKFIVHGLFGLAWYVLLVVQANLVRAGNVRLHRRLGKATFIVAIGVILSTLYVFVAVWKGWIAMGAEARANRLFLPGFAACLLLAWWRRGQPEWHKRLIFIGTFFMVDPVLARAFEPLIVTWLEPLLGSAYTRPLDEALFQLFKWGLWSGLFLSLAALDWKSLRRIHAVTAAGAGYFVLVCAVSQVGGGA